MRHFDVETISFGCGGGEGRFVEVIGRPARGSCFPSERRDVRVFLRMLEIKGRCRVMVIDWCGRRILRIAEEAPSRSFRGDSACAAKLVGALVHAEAGTRSIVFLRRLAKRTPGRRLSAPHARGMTHVKT
jgi:hypothetical protein